MTTLRSPSKPLLLFAAAEIAGALTFLGGPASLRVVVMLGFLLIVPGMALIGFLNIDDPLQTLTLAIATSLALASLASIASLYAGRWSPNGVLDMLLGVTIVGSIVQYVRRPRIYDRAGSRAASENAVVGLPTRTAAHGSSAPTEIDRLFSELAGTVHSLLTFGQRQEFARARALFTPEHDARFVREYGDLIHLQRPRRGRKANVAIPTVSVVRRLSDGRVAAVVVYNALQGDVAPDPEVYTFKFNTSKRRWLIDNIAPYTPD